ncbi:hypothetical protein MRB53_037348 [Persea americana]|nr:hypothetical protein MRB53_037348 [Persea americana]
MLSTLRPMMIGLRLAAHSDTSEACMVLSLWAPRRVARPRSLQPWCAPVDSARLISGRSADRQLIAVSLQDPEFAAVDASRDNSVRAAARLRDTHVVALVAQGQASIDGKANSAMRLGTETRESWNN